MNTYHFFCKKCKIKFSVEAESKHTNKLNDEFKRGIRCPKCDEKWGEGKIELEMNVGSVRNDKKSLDQRRKENAERSAMAEAMAIKARAEQGEQMTQISKPKNFQKSKYGGQSESVPKNVIESLKNKFPS